MKHRIFTFLALLLLIINLSSCKEQTAIPKLEFSWDNATVYFVYVDRFLNGDTTNDHNYGRKNDYGNELKNTATFHGGDIVGLTQKLREGYFTHLGVNAIWVTGMYEQIHGWVGGGSKNDFPHYGYHGYYPFDLTAMDKNYGTIEEFRTFVDLAHEQGIRVIMDAGLNHPGYLTLLDAVQGNFGGVKLTEKEAIKHSNGLEMAEDKEHFDAYGYLKEFDFDNDSAWLNYWGYDWIRTKEEVNKNVLTESIFGLPDFKTEVTSPVKLTPILRNKWEREGADFEPWIIPAAEALRKDMDAAPADYLIKWIAAWVEEFGIDGFRCDVLDNVDTFRWKQLNVECNAALVKWKKNNPTKSASKWDDKFWMTGDIWGSGIEYHKKYADVGFNSIVNFKFPKHGKLDSIGAVWQMYADSLNTRENWSTLSFLNSTYMRDANFDNMTDCGTSFLLAPGAVQIFYGDEIARMQKKTVASDASHGYRADMVWGKNNSILTHWQKLGQFRKKHLSVGAGKQIQLGENTFARTLNNDKIVIKIAESAETTVVVKGIFDDGVQIQNFYTGEVATVLNGKATFKVVNKVVLLESM